MIRVLLVDDQAVVRRGLRARLQLEQDIEVVGEASSGSDALELAQTLIPDVAVIDVEMPELDGIETTRQLRGIVPNCAVVILSIHDDAQTHERAHVAGALAFVEKRGGAEALLTAIRQAVAQAGESGE